MLIDPMGSGVRTHSSYQDVHILSEVQVMDVLSLLLHCLDGGRYTSHCAPDPLALTQSASELESRRKDDKCEKL